MWINCPEGNFFLDHITNQDCNHSRYIYQIVTLRQVKAQLDNGLERKQIKEVTKKNTRQSSLSHVIYSRHMSITVRLNINK